MDVKGLIRKTDNLFEKVRPLHSHWQDLAENFYPERANFTTTRNIGDELGIELMTSYPVLARRELADSFGQMLRPSSLPLLKMTTSRPDMLDVTASQYLEWASELQINAVTDPSANFVKCESLRENDVATFGQCISSVTVDLSVNSLKFVCHHLKEFVFTENSYGDINFIARKWKPEGDELRSMFSGSLTQKRLDEISKDPYKCVNVYQCIVETDKCSLEGYPKPRTPYVSVFIDVDEQAVIGYNGSFDLVYCISRWKTLPGSQYAYSPAVVAALADSRQLQTLVRILVEAGEKHVDPPMIGVMDAFKSPLDIMAGGFTAVDRDYDEKLGEVLRPLVQNPGTYNIGADMLVRLENALRSAFYLDKLDLPPVMGGEKMTAYETSQRVQEYVRKALPLIEPLENEMKAKEQEMVFNSLMRNNAFGSVSDIPKSLQGAEIKFVFETPLREAASRIKSGQFLEGQQITASAAQVDPTVLDSVDIVKAHRDVMQSTVPSSWLRTETEAEELTAKKKEEAMQAQIAQMAMSSLGGSNAG